MEGVAVVDFKTDAAVAVVKLTKGRPQDDAA